MSRAKIVDIAGSYENLLDATAVKAFGYPVMIHKATEGLTFVDPDVKIDAPKLVAAGMVTGLYHFFRPRYDCLQQAAHFYNTTKGMKFEFAVLDWETTDNLLTPSKQIDWVIRCGNEMRRLTGKTVLLYSGMWFLRQFTAADLQRLATAFPLYWNAAYPYKPTTPEQQTSYENIMQNLAGPSVAPWSGWFIWQWTDSGRIPGIDGAVDLNVAKLPLDEFLKAVGVSTGPVEPVPVTLQDLITEFIALKERVQILEQRGA